MVVGPCEAQIEIDVTRGAHTRFSYLEKLYEFLLDAEVEAESDDEMILHHRQCALRLYLMYLVGTTIFMEKSVTYVNVVDLTYFIDLERIGNVRLFYPII